MLGKPIFGKDAQLWVVMLTSPEFRNDSDCTLPHLNSPAGHQLRTESCSATLLCAAISSKASRRLK